MEKEKQIILVKKAKHGDAQAFVKLCEAYQMVLYNSAYKILLNNEDVADCLQEEVDTPNYGYDPETGRMDISFDLIAMDKTSVYKIQVNEVDQMSGEMLSEFGYFELQNK
ncbi:RNA polymerase sigma factor [Enterococcus sp. 5H]|uniref:RNA polymerase sigma factor n=1 Tax=Enterococcus sp. 5H TaxID=1229490 RepID=UPI002304ACDA|nr:hypothetical protein [Enterococcus sp. 5H]MDA9470915.1 hypothetical protein [Enterococcus sp. 5H]